MDAVARFAELVGQPDPPLDQAALALAAGADPALDPAPWLAELDRLAAGVGSLDAAAAPAVRARRASPATSATTTIRATRCSTTCCAAGSGSRSPSRWWPSRSGRRAGVALEGVGMPGHFLVRVLGTAGLPGRLRRRRGR